MDRLNLLGSTLFGVTLGYTLMRGVCRITENILSGTISGLEQIKCGKRVGVLFGLNNS